MCQNERQIYCSELRPEGFALKIMRSHKSPRPDVFLLRHFSVGYAFCALGILLRNSSFDRKVRKAEISNASVH